MQLDKQEKHLSNLMCGRGRLKLVKMLLNKELRYFDFEVLKCYTGVQRCDWELYLMFLSEFNEIWDELAAKCPKLLKIREMRPIDFSGNHFPALNPKVYTFKRLLCLETNSIVDSGLHTD